MYKPADDAGVLLCQVKAVSKRKGCHLYEYEFVYPVATVMLCIG